MSLNKSVFCFSEPMKNERIIEPRPDQVFLVDLGKHKRVPV